MRKANRIKWTFLQPLLSNHKQNSTSINNSASNSSPNSNGHEDIEFRKAIEKLVHLGGFQYAVDSDRFLISETGRSIYELNEREQISLQEFIQLHQFPENETLDSKFSDAISTGMHFQMEIKTSGTGFLQKTIKIICCTEKSNNNNYKIWGTIQDISQQKKQEEDRLYAEIQQQQKIIDREIWKHENVRGWISYELHEDIAQVLIAARNHLRFPQTPTNNKQLNQTSFLTEAEYFLEEAIQKIKILYEKLEVPPLQLIGLQGCIQELIEKESSQGTTTMIFNNKAKCLEKLEVPVKMILYRIIHEKINNIIKHAKADNAWIGIEWDKNEIILTVKDNGVGFYNTERHWRNGLHMIKTFVTSLGGIMRLNSSPGRGCELFVLIPINKVKSPATLA